MEIIASPPLRVASVLWRSGSSQWKRTIVCKLTYLMEPGISRPASEQEPIWEEERCWQEDPTRSVFQPNDLVPFKASPEVLLVGHAFAPDAEQVRSLSARLLVGDVDKTIEVFCSRYVTPDGDMREGPRWKKMPLAYERASGGPDTWNPVGVHRGREQDAASYRSLPNLQPPGMYVDSADMVIPPIGFGPISWQWPRRRERLGSAAAGWAEERWRELVLDRHFDRRFFQCAPEDQWLTVLRPDERIVLENLHPDLPRLVTNLDGMSPRAFYTLPVGPAALPLVADTLWIDTDRSICTVTWRGQIQLQTVDQPDRMLIALASSGRELSWSEVSTMLVGSDQRTSPAVTRGSVASPVTPAPQAGERASRPPTIPPPASPPWNQSDAGSVTFDTSTAEAHVSSLSPPWLKGNAPASPSHALPFVPTAPVAAEVDQRVSYSSPSSLPSSLPSSPQRPPRSPPPAPQVSFGALPASSDGSKTLDGLSGLNDFAPAWLPGAEGGPGPVRTPPRPGPSARQKSQLPPPLPVPTPPPAFTPPASAPPPAFTPPAPAPVPVFTPPAPAPVPPPVFTPPLPASVLPPVFTPPAPAPVPPTISPAPSISTPLPLPAPAPVTKTSHPERVDLGEVNQDALARASYAGALAASNAASEPRRFKRGRSDAAPEASEPAPAAATELIWFDPAVVPKMRKNKEWWRLMKPPPKPEPPLAGDPDVASPLEPSLQPDGEEPPPKPDEPDDDEPPPSEPGDAEARGKMNDVSRVITRATPTSGRRLDAMIMSSLEEGGTLKPPLILVAGELHFPFDEAETLKLMVDAASPLAAQDKRLKETVDRIQELMKTPLQRSGEVARGFIEKLRQAWGKGDRMLPAGYLDENIDRLLLEQRKYQRRELLKGKWIRALLVLPEVEGGPVPTYLPDSIAGEIPLYRSFHARLIAEALPQQDQYETCAVALKATALARVLGGRRPGAARS